MGDFYGTKIEIWAGFGPIGITEKKIWADYEQLLRVFFSVFRGETNVKKFLKHCSLRAKKVHKMKLKNIFFSENLFKNVNFFFFFFLFF